MEFRAEGPRRGVREKEKGEEERERGGRGGGGQERNET